jgi:isopentenyl diphosphate isomerase/L-lactate dehydrogenase-like FMN-dependent dehydrogenase
MPIFLAPTAMQRLYHHEGDKASARAAEKFGTFYSMSTMATLLLKKYPTFQVVQNYFNSTFTKIKVLLMI